MLRQVPQKQPLERGPASCWQRGSWEFKDLPSRLILGSGLTFHQHSHISNVRKVGKGAISTLFLEPQVGLPFPLELEEDPKRGNGTQSPVGQRHQPT